LGDYVLKPVYSGIGWGAAVPDGNYCTQSEGLTSFCYFSWKITGNVLFPP